jgi:hypothetical protein
MDGLNDWNSPFFTMRLTPFPVGDISFARDKGCFKFYDTEIGGISAELWALLLVTSRLVLALYEGNLCQC